MKEVIGVRFLMCSLRPHGATNESREKACPRSPFPFWSLLIAVCLLAQAQAQSTSLGEILQQQRLLQEEIDKDVISLTPSQGSIVRDAQREVFALTDGRKTLSELNVVEKTRLENALERINAAVKGGRVATEEQQVCWRERKTGTKLMVTRCGTKQEVEQNREQARAHLERSRVCVASAGTCGQ